MSPSPEAARALQHLRQLTRDRANGTIPPHHIPTYPPAPPAAAPRKRNAADMDDEELPESPKKKKLVRAALLEKSAAPANVKVQGTQQPQKKRDRDIQETAAVDSSAKRECGHAASQSTEKPAQDKTKEQANNKTKPSVAASTSTAPGASVEQPHTSTIRAPRLDRVPGAQAFYGKHGPPKLTPLTVRRVVTTAPAPASNPGLAATSAAGQKRKCDSEERSSAKKAKTQNKEASRPSGKIGVTKPQATSSKAPITAKPTGAKPRGFLNYGKSCYANAVLQCLGTSEAFVTHFKAMSGGAARTNETAFPSYILEGAVSKRGEKGRNFLKQTVKRFDEHKISIGSDLGDLFQQMENSAGCKDPINLVLFLHLFAKATATMINGAHRFEGTSAEDASEFLHHLFNHLKDDEHRKRNERSSAPTDLRELTGVQGVLTVKCSRCGHVKNEAPNEYSLTSPPQLREGDEEKTNDKRKQESTPQTLWDRLDLCTRKVSCPEKVCIKCNQRGGVSTKLGLGDMAPFVAFEVPRIKEGLIKVDTPILPQINPKDFSRWAPESGAAPGGKYELCGIVEQHGSGISDRHYSALVKTRTSQQDWWFCKDRTVKKVQKDEINGKDKHGKPLHGEGQLFFLRRVD